MFRSGFSEGLHIRVFHELAREHCKIGCPAPTSMMLHGPSCRPCADAPSAIKCAGNAFRIVSPHDFARDMAGTCQRISRLRVAHATVARWCISIDLPAFGAHGSRVRIEQTRCAGVTAQLLRDGRRVARHTRRSQEPPTAASRPRLRRMILDMTVHRGFIRQTASQIFSPKRDGTVQLLITELRCANFFHCGGLTHFVSASPHLLTYLNCARAFIGKESS